jgi:hypothetical protein
MRKPSSALFILMLLGATHPAGAAEEPRALIERALKAIGGAEAVKQRIAVRMKLKGTIHGGDLLGPIPVEGELSEFGPRAKMVFQLEVAGNKSSTMVVIDGAKSWRDIGGNVVDFSKEDIDSLAVSRHQDRVTSLIALLTDKGFTFAPLDEIKVEGRPASGIKVSYKGQPDTLLYFDKETGFLAKYAYRAKKAGDMKEALHETVLTDYREPDLASADEKLLREAKIDVTGSALLALVRKQAPDPAAVAKVRTLIRKLADDSFKVREQASKDLVTLGAVAIPLLRAAARDDDDEVARRARSCLRQIRARAGETAVNAATIGAVIRLLGLRKPAGAAEVLLNYLPGADPEVAGDVRAALFALAQQDGKPNPVLLKALDDKDPARRAAAAAALGRDGGAYAKQPGRRLFLHPRKFAMKHKGWVDGKIQMEIETSDYQFFNAFDDKVFAKPSTGGDVIPRR